MTHLNHNTVKLINTYLALVPDCYKLGERRLVFDRVNLMAESNLQRFLEKKIDGCKVPCNTVRESDRRMSEHSSIL